MNQELCTAYHEAGHALAAHVHNIPLAKVSIEPTDGFIGRTNELVPANRTGS
jgi:ATP-dependent Zn protease